MLLIALPLAAYLLGSVSAAIIVARLMGLPDPRTTGSGNPGATNVLRGGHRLAAALTLAGDTLKGAVPMVAAHLLSGGYLNPLLLALTGLAAFLGHLYPVFFGFRGGKGIATGLGVYLGLNPLIAFFLGAVWMTVAGITRYSSLAAMMAAIVSPFVMLWLAPYPELVAMSVALAALTLWRHRSNMRNLVEGRESRIGRKAT